MDVGVRDLLEAGVHFGHQTRRWNPKMRRFIFMQRGGIYIIDLNKTMAALEEAEKLIESVVRAGKSVLLVGTKRQAKDPIVREAGRAGMFYVTERWLGGMLTNFKTIRSSIRRLIDIEKMAEDGTTEQLTKKEAGRLEKERARLDKVFRGIKEMEGLPGLMVVIDTKREQIAVREANRLGIPIMGIVDTNCDPDLITHPIPGNDDAMRAVDLYARFVGESVLNSKTVMAEGADTAAPATSAAATAAATTTQPAETKPAETKPAETKPAETKPAEAPAKDEAKSPAAARAAAAAGASAAAANPPIPSES